MDVNTGLWSIYPASGDTLAPTRTGSLHVTLHSYVSGINHLFCPQDPSVMYSVSSMEFTIFMVFNSLVSA
jgi:hypothetical protein